MHPFAGFYMSNDHSCFRKGKWSAFRLMFPNTPLSERRTMIGISVPTVRLLDLVLLAAESYADVPFEVTVLHPNMNGMFAIGDINGDGLQWVKQSWSTSHGVWQGVVGDVGSDGDMDILSANYKDDAPQGFWENKLDPAVPVTVRLRKANTHQLSTPIACEYSENSSYLINGRKMAANRHRWWSGICSFPAGKVKNTIHCTITNGGNR